MLRKLSFVYGILCYLAFLVSFVYAIGFVGDIVVPKSVDTGPEAPLVEAILINIAVLGVFGLQHSVMARPGFKRWWTKIVSKPIERSTFVLASALALGLIFWQWRPLPTVIWEFEASWAVSLMWGLFGLGWAIVLASAHMIDGAHLFGVKQVWEHLNEEEISAPEFRTPGLYRYVRHPLMFGFIIAFWATPQMTLGHLLFSVVVTGYIFVGIYFEERDLVRTFGERYERYRQEVPMIIPIPGKSADRAPAPSPGEAAPAEGE